MKAMKNIATATFLTLLMTASNPSLKAQESNTIPVPDSPYGIRPLIIGSRIPESSVTDINGNNIKLAEQIKLQPAILIFYRGGWCPFCNLQMSQIQKIVPDLKQLGYQILAVSPDKISELRKSIEKNQLQYSLFSDSSMALTRAFGIAFKVPDSTVEKYREHNMDLDESSGENHHLLPVPSVFITNTEGVIEFEYINPNYKKRIDPDVLVAAAKSLLK